MIFEYLRNNQLPNFENASKKQLFIKKCRKLILINERIFVSLELNPLEYICSFETERKFDLINRINMQSHRGIHTLFNELKNLYYNISREDVKQVLSECVVCSRRTVTTEIERIRPIVLLQKLDRLQIDITYMVEYSEENMGFKYILTVIDCF
jgi:hypothetical protein